MILRSLKNAIGAVVILCLAATSSQAQQIQEDCRPAEAAAVAGAGVGAGIGATAVVGALALAGLCTVTFGLGCVLAAGAGAVVGGAAGADVSEEVGELFCDE